MTELEELPNIGKVLADRLRASGVGSAEQLLQLGDAAAFRKIRAGLPDDACTHTRLALAGAIRGVRWHSLGQALRAQLTEDAHART
jgi:DNA transformation protein and related proteins